ncbi:MAG TPA: hypothetical protein VF286_09650 [Acidiphilium sp.]
MTIAVRLLATLIDLGAMVVLAFVLESLARLFAAWRAGLVPAPAAQTGRDLVRLLRKRRLRPAFASPLYPVWPVLAFAVTGVAVLILPGFAGHLVTEPLASLPLLIGLLALGRAARLFAALEAGEGAHGRAAARATTEAACAEAVWLIAMAALAIAAGSLSIGGIAAAAPGQPRVLVPAALAALVAVRGFGELPPDDYAGPERAIFLAETMLRRVVLLGVLIDVAIPFGMADAGSVLSWPLGLLVWVVKLVVLFGIVTLADASAPRGVLRLGLPLSILALILVFASGFSVSGVLVGLGCIGVIVGVIRLWRRTPALEAASFTQAGAALIGFGIGAMTAGWLLLASIVLARLTGFVAGRHPTVSGHSWIAAGCAVAMAGLPPFGLFAGDFGVLREAIGHSLPLGVFLVVFLAISAILLIVRLPVGAGGARGRPATTTAIAAVLLALLVALGVAPSLIGFVG